MVMKPLHDILDERRVSTVIVSGCPLDAANMNRMLSFQRHTQSLKDQNKGGLDIFRTP